MGKVRRGIGPGRPTGESHIPSSRAVPCFGGEGEYTQEEVDFIMAMDRLKRRLRKHPTCVEVLAEAVRLGYRKVGVEHEKKTSDSSGRGSRSNGKFSDDAKGSGD